MRFATASKQVASVIERFSRQIGHGVAWATLLMVLTTALVVVLRHVFQVGWIWLQEVSVYLHALVFLLGAAYTLGDDQHVRVDVFYRGFPHTWKRWVNTLGVVFFLLPTTAFIFWSSWSYVLRSWANRETSHETGGLLYPFPSLLKTSILIACVMLALQGIAMIVRSWYPEESGTHPHHTPEI
ncbi:MAG: TRAP transporter small permease subunit [Gammaproteobacteria bacterium]|nr:TRAP transporter small permease subunit [Gammaproteobacteria bacterium]